MTPAERQNCLRINPGSTLTTPCLFSSLKAESILDFWTSAVLTACVLPELEGLEQKYKDSLTVIGVHSAKFDNRENIRQAILRNIEHPVPLTVVSVFGCRCLAYVDGTDRYVVSYVSGEGNRTF